MLLIQEENMEIVLVLHSGCEKIMFKFKYTHIYFTHLSSNENRRYARISVLITQLHPCCQTKVLLYRHQQHHWSLHSKCEDHLNWHCVLFTKNSLQKIGIQLFTFSDSITDIVIIVFSETYILF